VAVAVDVDDYTMVDARAATRLPRRFKTKVVYVLRAIQGSSLICGKRMIWREAPMRFEKFSFGHITIDGVTYDHDVVIDHGKVRKRVKKPSKKLRGAFAHTPLSAAEEIPWKCRRLVIGTGAYGNLPVTNDVKREAARRELELVILPTVEAIKALQMSSRRTNAVLHVTC
jgi:hypothetical protein